MTLDVKKKKQNVLTQLVRKRTLDEQLVKNILSFVPSRISSTRKTRSMWLTIICAYLIQKSLHVELFFPSFSLSINKTIGSGRSTLLHVEIHVLNSSITLEQRLEMNKGPLEHDYRILSLLYHVFETYSLTNYNDIFIHLRRDPTAVVEISRFPVQPSKIIVLPESIRLFWNMMSQLPHRKQGVSHVSPSITVTQLFREFPQHTYQEIMQDMDFD